MLVCLSFIGIWGIEQQFRGNDRLEGLGGNAWGDSNGVAAIFVMFLPVAIARLFTSGSRREKLAALGVVAIMVALVVCTKSRAGLLGLVAGIVAYGYFSCSMKKVVIAGLLMSLAAAPFATQAYLERMRTMKSAETLDDSARSRLVLWKAGLMIFADNPLVGTGFLTYPQAKMRYERHFDQLDDKFRAEVFREQDRKVTHNTYIQMMADCGLMGIVPFLLLIAGGVFAGVRARSYRARHPDQRDQLTLLCGLSAGITGYAVCMITADMVTVMFLYVQLTFTAILSHLIAEQGAPAATREA
jgi:O-antigen ligase